MSEFCLQLGDELLGGHLADHGVVFVSPRAVAEAARLADRRAYAGVVLAGLMAAAGVADDRQLGGLRDSLLGADRC